MRILSKKVLRTAGMIFLMASSHVASATVSGPDPKALPASKSASASTAPVKLGSTTIMVTKSFDEWKNEKVQTAKDRIAKARSRDAVEHSRDSSQQVVQEDFNLEVSQNLSVTDYVVLYLSTQTGSAKFLEAAARMTPFETAKLLEAYLKAMQSQSESEHAGQFRSSSIEGFD